MLKSYSNMCKSSPNRTPVKRMVEEIVQDTMDVTGDQPNFEVQNRSLFCNPDRNGETPV